MAHLVENNVNSSNFPKDDLNIAAVFQEEEIDDLAGQVQLLEQSKLKLEMSMAAMKKEHRREVSVKVTNLLFRNFLQG